MNLWSPRFALPVETWLPLGLAFLAPLLVVVVILPISRRRARGIATVLALRTVTLLALGFAMLATVATLAVVQTGLRELVTRHAREVRGMAQSLADNPLGIAAGDASLRLELFRARDPDFAFVAAATDACRSTCRVSFPDDTFDARALRARLNSVWPPDGHPRTATIGGHPYLLLTAAIGDGGAQPPSALLAAIDTGYLADQAARTAWLLLAMSYGLLLVVGWSSWQQVRRTLAARIHAINTRLLSGAADAVDEHSDVDGHELHDLAESVSVYIKRTLDEKSSSDERYRRLVELAPDAVLMCADTRIRSANPAAVTLAGARNQAEMIGSTVDRFLRLDDPRLDPAHGSGGRLATWKQLDGTMLHVEVTEIADSIGGELVRQFVVRDVTRSRRREADLTHRAEHDALTGLVNRARFEARLRELLAAGGAGKVRESSDVAVLFIDLDGFKPVNDTFGHAAGDAVLVAVAARLRDSTRGTDLVARLGGDEFAVLLEVRDTHEVEAVADRILRALHQPISSGSSTVSIRASIGIANTRARPVALSTDAFERSMTAAELLKAADASMYAAKSAGGDRYVSDAIGPQSPSIRAGITFPAMA